MSVIKEVLSIDEKRANAQYFQKIIEVSAKYYMWKDLGELFIVKDGKLYGTQSGVDACKEITPISFHNKFVVNGN